MTIGQLFQKVFPDIQVTENGTCVWLNETEFPNHHTLDMGWWSTEIPTDIDELQIKSYEKKLKARDTEIDMLKRFLASLSFYHKSKDYMFLSDRAKACTCGKHPVIMPYVLDSTCWVAQCKNCASRTVEAASPLQAVRFWNEDNLTEDTKLMRKPRDLDKGGIDHLAAALKKGAIKDLLWAERTGHLDSKIAEEARWWLKRDPKLIEDIESGAMRKRMEAMNEAEKKELEEDDLH